MLTRRAVVQGALGTAAFAAVARAANLPGVPAATRELHVPVQGGSIYVRVNGDLKAARSPILFVHGGPGGALWQFFPALPLAQDRAVILYDQLDSGQSDAPGDKANWTVDRFASEIGAIRSALNLEKLHIVGHSWGGIIANRYAATQPEGLKSLILQGTPLSAARALRSVRSLLPALPDDMGKIILDHQKAGKPDDPAYGKATMAFMRKHLFRTSVKDIAMPYMVGTPPDRGDALAQAMTGNDLLMGFDGILKGFDDEPLMRKIIVPTLLLIGQYDIMTPTETRAMLPMLRHGSYAEIADAGHMAQFDQPEKWRDAISRFIKTQD